MYEAQITDVTIKTSIFLFIKAVNSRDQLERNACGNISPPRDEILQF